MNPEEMILAILAKTSEESAWLKLIHIFGADRRVFYSLADLDIGTVQAPSVRDLVTLAILVRAAIAETYEIEPSSDGYLLKTASGKQLLVPESLVGAVREFLLIIDGKGKTDVPGRDYEGEQVSEAEAQFKLGNPAKWDSEHEELQTRRKAKPRVLKVDEQDLSHLRVLPPYVTRELLDCARRTILSPCCVFKGLRRGDGSRPEVDDGWAFCGKPRHAVRNDGSWSEPPANMVYVVYADANNYVFDWDWVLEHPHDPGLPLDWNMRYANPHPMDSDAVLDLPKDLSPGDFSRTRACYSRRGDCIFCYMTPDESFAERINCDLTVFRSLANGKYTGFKIKNIQRILQVDKNIVIQGAPGLSVSVDSVLFASLMRHPDRQIQIYQVLIKALYQAQDEPPKVDLPPEAAEAVAAK